MSDKTNTIIDVIKSSFNKNLLYAVLALILIPLILVIVLKFTPKNRLISKLNYFADKINECNLTLNDGINDKTINPSNSKDLLSSGILTLDAIKDDIESLEVKAEFTDIKSTFKKTLDYNIGLYEASLSILKDPTSKDIKSKYTSLENNMKLFNESSKSLDLFGVNYTLNNISITFFNNMKNYTNALVKVTMQSDILDDQKREFAIQMDKSLTTLNNLKKDFKTSIDLIKKDNRSLDVIIDEINSKKSAFASLEKLSRAVSIPTIGKDTYSSLEETLKLYSLYIQELESTVLADKASSGDNDSSSTLEEKYTSAYSKYDDFLNSLQRLDEHISALKN